MSQDIFGTDENGSVSLEAALLTPVLVIVVILFVSIIRLSVASANLKHIVMIHADYSANKDKSFMDAGLINIRAKGQWLEAGAGPYTLGPYEENGLMLVTARWHMKIPLFGEKVLEQSGVSRIWPAYHNQSTDIWSLPPTTRGYKIQENFGRNLPRYFPCICKFDYGVATSVISVDLTSKTYEVPQEFFNNIYEAILKLKEFNGGSNEGVSVKGASIVAKELLVIVPKSTLNQRLTEEYKEAFRQGRDFGIEVRIIEFQKKEET